MNTGEYHGMGGMRRAAQTVKTIGFHCRSAARATALWLTRGLSAKVNTRAKFVVYKIKRGPGPAGGAVRPRNSRILQRHDFLEFDQGCLLDIVGNEDEVDVPDRCGL